MPSPDFRTHPDALTVARQHAEAGRFDDFVGLCRQVGESFPDEQAALLDVGALLANYGFLADAIVCYQRAHMARANRPACDDKPCQLVP